MFATFKQIPAKISDYHSLSRRKIFYNKFKKQKESISQSNNYKRLLFVQSMQVSHRFSQKYNIIFLIICFKYSV